MKRKIYLLLSGLLMITGLTFAQTARVQIIHNSADAAASPVDIYVNGTLAFDNVPFRAATPFSTVPAGVTLNVGIAPGTSTSVNDTIVNFAVSFANNQTYVVVADGIVSPTGYTPAQPFGLAVYGMGRETASNTMNTDVLVHHGSTDAPTVDVYETGVGAGLIVDDLAYTDFAGYLELPTADYTLEVRDQTGMTTVATYQAPLSTLNLGGEALVVVASGFLNPANNSNGPAFGLYVALASGGPLVALPEVQTARVQIIHNSADAAASPVDIYVEGALAFDNVPFRAATAFTTVPAGVTLNVGIAPGNSTSVNDTIVNFPVSFANNETYVVVADGIVSPTGYTPAQPFGLAVYGMGREMATNSMNTDVLVHHGSTDAPTVDVYETGVGAGLIVDDLAYTDFAGYLELPTADYTIEIRDQTGMTTVASYSAPLSTLGLDGQALVVVASGFLDPTNNSNGPAFGLYVALPTGGPLVALPETQTARVQIIHNSADAAASPVDIYVEGALAFDNVPFRVATAFTTVPAGVTLNVGIAPGNSTSVSDTIVNFPVTFAANETYVVVADGIVSPTGYTPAQPFGLAVYGMGREMATNSMNTDVLVHHGSTDAPTVDVYETGVGAGLIVDDLAYTDFAGYLELPTADYTLEIRDETGTTTVASYEAPLSTLGLDGQALVVVASGFLDPSNNSNGPAFGLYVALASGGPLVALPVSAPNSVSEVSNLSVKMYPNPASDFVRIEGIDLTTVNVTVYDIAGRNVGNSFQINGNTIDISKLENGMYQMVLINSNQEMTTLKLVKNK